MLHSAKEAWFYFTHRQEITPLLELIVSMCTVRQDKPVELCIKYANGAWQQLCGLTCLDHRQYLIETEPLWSH